MMPNQESPRRRAQAGAHMNRSAGAFDLSAELRQAIEEASELRPNYGRAYDDGRFVPYARPLNAGLFRELPLAFPEPSPQGRLAASSCEARLGAAIAAHSVLARLGLTLMEAAEPGDPREVQLSNGKKMLVAETAAREFRIPAPAPFSEVSEGDDALSAAKLGDVTLVSKSGLRMHGFSHTISHKAMKDRGLEVIASELAESIALGAGRLIDRVALAALSTGLPVGDMRVAGAAGVAFDRLRAVIGTGALSVEPVADRGELFHAGVPAVLTPDAAESWLGDWSTHCLLHSRNMTVTFAKQVNDSIVIAAWIAAEAVTPMAGATKLWKLA